jgi:hypothetical protein
VAGTQGNARASAALCGAASIVMSLLQQIPEEYHDHDDVHNKTCTMHSQEGKYIHKQSKIPGLYLQDHQIEID